MLAYPIATTALLIGTASAAANPQHKTSFMRAMDTRKKSQRRRLSQKDFLSELYGDSKKSAILRKKMIQKSKLTKAPGSPDGKRKLQNNNYYNQDASANANQNYYNQNANANANQDANADNGSNSYTNYKSNLYSTEVDGSDDYFNTYGE